VRVLSRRTQDSTQEIQSTIETLQQTTARAVSLMQTSQGLADNSVQDADAAAAALEEITQAVVQIHDLSSQIATAAEEQSRVTEEINRNMVSIRDMLNLLVENGGNTEQSAATLLGSNRQLLALVHRFKV